MKKCGFKIYAHGNLEEKTLILMHDELKKALSEELKVQFSITKEQF